MIKPTSETIVALATPIGRGGVAIIRASGPLVPELMLKMLHRICQPRVATFAKFYGLNDEPIDAGLALFFQAPDSFTGEHVLELHVHGSPIIVDQLLEIICMHGARLAEPGEFSKRAFLNGKMDLTQAEAVADLINASSREAAAAAFQSLQGEFSNQIKMIRPQLIYVRTQVEAQIDFGEEDIRPDNGEKLINHVELLLNKLKTLHQEARDAMHLQEAVEVVIAGKPNVGKSTLLNSLCAEELAIVTPIAGTTRDMVKGEIFIDGIAIKLIDTAGLRATEDVIESEGIKRTLSAMRTAQIILYVIDVNQKCDLPKIEQEIRTYTDCPIIWLGNKMDLAHHDVCQDYFELPILTISAKTKQGLAQIKKIIKEMLVTNTVCKNKFLARRRHISALQNAESFLQAALHHMQHQSQHDFCAEDLRLAQNALDEITGVFSTEDLLGEIFSTFCIGK